jgi:hypothetical protein
VSCDWLLIDGSSMIFRAFYGVPASVRGPDGQPINAIRGFLDTLARLIVQRRPRQLAVASDEDWRPRGGSPSSPPTRPTGWPSRCRPDSLPRWP